VTSYTDHNISQAAFIIAKTDDSVGPFSVFCRTVVVGSFFDFKFNKVQDFEKKKDKKGLADTKSLFCYPAVLVLVAVSSFYHQSNKNNIPCHYYSSNKLQDIETK